jgi:REP element-mobilizing transposase RayT
MPRRDIEFRAGECYHVYNRGNNREPIFFERKNYVFFLQRLWQYIAGGQREDSTPSKNPPTAEILAYCLMPNHYHLLLRLLTDEISAPMQSFSQSYTNAVNRHYGRVGSVFQGRFQALHVDTDEYLLHLSRYIHLNPIEARLVLKPEDWKFSSYREYAGLRAGQLPRPERILRTFPSRVAYREFVDSGIGKNDPKVSHLMID